MSSEYTSKGLDQLVNQRIERLTGKLPARATARSYRNDPVDEDNLWKFHSDTLLHFDPKWLSSNFRQAVEYFGVELEQTPAKAADLIGMLPSVLKRIKNIFQDAEKIKRSDAYHTRFSSRHHENIRINYVRLLLLYARVQELTEKIDEAIAVLNDAKLITGEMGGTR